MCLRIYKIQVVLLKNMKSKSFNLKQSPVDYGKPHKTFDFVGLYKTAAETNKILSESKPPELQKNERKNKIDTPKYERTPNKNKKRVKNEPIEISQINIDGSNLFPSTVHNNTPMNEPKDTSTPNISTKTKARAGKVKSIMKNQSVNDVAVKEITKVNVSTGSKPKKRNKSVSFMLDDNEELVIKKTKSNDYLKVDKNKDNPTSKTIIKNEKRKKSKKLKKDNQSEKENKEIEVNNQMETDQGSIDQPQEITEKPKHLLDEAKDSANLNQEKRKKFKKVNKQKVDGSEEIDKEVNSETLEIKNKKSKKKKRQAKPSMEIIDNEGEPITKSRKKEIKPDVIVDNLENLRIGDNAHTLTNLLDEMTVVDKEKHKKVKKKFNKDKKQKSAIVTSEEADIVENIEEKEKIKWRRRKWNKDKKGEVDEENQTHTIIIEGLPLSIMLTYKSLLTDHFEKYGLIKKHGIAEVYPTEESQPVFTTTISFYSDGAAQQALEADKTKIEGSLIRVKRTLPPTETTIVVRSYAELNEQAISSVFSGAGKIRSIRHLVKGKKAMGTAFVEFDGPKTVERATKMAAEAKIGGKKIYIAKFELRKKKTMNEAKNNTESEPEADDSDNSD